MGNLDPVMLLENLSISLGSRGGDVRRLHRALSRLDYDVDLAERQFEYFGETTNEAVLAFQEAEGLRRDGVVDTRVAQAIEYAICSATPPSNCIIRGCVKDASSGTPAVGVTVRAFDAGWAGNPTLGNDAVTGNDGQFTITYVPPANDRPDIYAGVLNGAGPGLLTQSGTYYNAPCEVIIDLVLGSVQTLTEVDRLANDISLATGATPPSTILPTQVPFLEGKTDWPAQWIEFLIDADKAVVFFSGTIAIPISYFYGWFRDGLPTDLDQLVRSPNSVLRQALERSAANRIIPALTVNELNALDTVIATMRRLRVSTAAPLLQDGLEYLRIGGIISQQNKDTFLDLWYRKRVTLAGFWTDLGTALNDANKLAALQLYFQLCAIARNHQPMVQSLWASRGNWVSLINLAKETRQDWLTRIGGINPKYPPDVPGSDDTTRRGKYADIIMETLGHMFPSMGTWRELGGINTNFAIDLRNLLNNNTSFDPRTGVVDAIVGLSENDRTTLLRYQRLARVSALPRHTGVLVAKDYTSARQIVDVGERDFVANVTDDPALLNTDEAHDLFQRAATIAGQAQNLLVAFGGQGQVTTRFVPQPSLPGASGGAPNVKAMLGGADYCACEHCSSVFSPAAYLVEVLQLLVRGPKVSNLYAIDRLYYVDGNGAVVRRPDIGTLLLTCDNTNTVLPYLDLVNEILESVVTEQMQSGHLLVGGNPPPGPQTTRSAEELRLTPEYTNYLAYNNVNLDDNCTGGRVWPAPLPYELPLDEARTWIAQLGTTLAGVRRTFLPMFPAPSTAATTRLAVDELGISKVQAQVLTARHASVTSTPWIIWGLTENAARTNPLDAGVTYTGWQNILGRGYFLAAQAGISDSQTRALFGAAAVATLGFTWYWPADKCHFAYAEVQNGDAAAFKRLSRFLRFARCSGWSIEEAARFCGVFGGPLDSTNSRWDDPDSLDTFLRATAAFKRVQARTALSFAELLSWYGPLGAGRDLDAPLAPYDEVFRNPKVFSPLATELKLDANGETQTPNAAILPAQTASDPYVAAVAAGCNLTLDDLRLLLVAASPPAGKVVNTLTRVHLSELYRTGSLCRHLGISVAEYLRLRALVPYDPFGGGGALPDPAGTESFLDAIDFVRSSGLSVAEIDWLLTSQTTLPEVVAPTDAAVATDLERLQQDLRKIARETEIKLSAGETLAHADPAGARLLKELTTLYGREAAHALVEAIRTGLGNDPEESPLAQVPGDGGNPGVSHTVSIEVDFDVTHRYISVLYPNNWPALQTQMVTIQLRTDPQQNPTQVAVEALAVPNGVARVLATQTATSIIDATLAAGNGAGIVELRVLRRSKEEMIAAYAAARSAFVLLQPLLQDAQDVWRNIIDEDTAWDGGANNYRAAGAPIITDPALRFGTLLDVILPKIRADRMRQALVKAVSERFNVGAKVAATMLVARDGLPLSDLRGAWVDQAVDPASGTGEHWLYLAKLALYLRRLGVGADEMGMIVYQSGDATDYTVSLKGAGWLLPRALRGRAAAAAGDIANGVQPFIALRHSATTLGLRTALPSLVGTLLEVLKELPPQSGNGGLNAKLSLEALAKLTGWDDKDLGVTAKYLGLVDSDDIHGNPQYSASLLSALWNGTAFWRLLDAMAMLRRLGVRASEATAAWVKAIEDASGSVTAEIARAIRAAVRQRYSAEQWAEVAAPLQDALRERQRDALVAHLVKKLGLPDARALSERFLIDVEMSACQLTSRIKQALSSAQMFVQRAAMKLEVNVQLDAQTHSQWTAWMSRYRLWEANRKIFIWPENWIEPDLRTDKTPFFDDLESELAQGDLTPERVEQAYTHYLEKLDEVANLEVIAVARDLVTDAQLREGGTATGGSGGTGGVAQTPGIRGTALAHVVHVIARTRKQPHTLFHRQLLDGVRWTPWQKIDVEVESEYVVARVWDRALYLLWVNVSDKSRQSNAPSGDKRPERVEEARVAWIEWKNGRWGGRRSSKKAIPIDREFALPKNQLQLYALTGEELADLTGKDIAGGTLQVVLRFPYYPLPLNSGQYFGAWFQISACTGEVATQTLDAAFPKKPFLLDMTQLVREGAVQRASYIDEPVSLADPFGDGNPLLEAPQELVRVIGPSDNVEGFALPGFLIDRLRSYVVQDVNAGEDDPASLTDPAKASPNRSSKGAGSGRVFDEAERGTLTWSVESSGTYRVIGFHHPYACEFLTRLKRSGVGALLAPDTQALAESGNVFDDVYGPADSVALPLPVDRVDFNADSPYGAYNWELFFHAPLRIAVALSGNKRFEEAMRWFHFIFDPTAADVSGDLTKAWRFKPFRDAVVNPVAELLAALSYSGGNAAGVRARAAMKAAVADWREHPFDPHRVARMRTSAYMRAVVMKYLDNLLSWGDYLFQQDTLESINMAVTLYFRAADLLGPRPQRYEQRNTAEPYSYETMRGEVGGIDSFGNKLLEVENLVPYKPPAKHPMGRGWAYERTTPPAPQPISPVFYFCIPVNERLLSYWDLVEDRLYKIRHCMNIAGVVRQLALFEPPIDPAMLVRMAASGLDLSTAIADLNAPSPIHRFPVALQKALELCGELKGLGGSLLQAMEKRDTERLGLLRAHQEIGLLKAGREVRRLHIREANETLAGLQETAEAAKAKFDYYNTRLFMTAEETQHLTLSGNVSTLQSIASGLSSSASGISLVPEFRLGSAGMASPGIHAEFGGRELAAMLNGQSSMVQAIAGMVSMQAASNQTMATYYRRKDEWDHQKNLASIDMRQIARQSAAAERKVDIAERELENHEQQLENSQAVEEVLKTKFTNEALYNWMVGRLSEIYFQAWDLTYAAAKRAERAFRFERGEDHPTFISAGAWDNLKAGLLAGDRLNHDLRRLEAAYLDEARRDFELTRHVSLLEIAPDQLEALKHTGTCTFDLPESLFDRDYPGHYQRRIKTVAVTIPCTTGPYSGVRGRLTLLQSRIRVSTLANDPPPPKYVEDTSAPDPRFSYDFAATQSIALSSGQNDSGLFETNLRDERYLPFEGAGAISRFRLELSRRYNDFDVDSISDVILHLRYTARDGGELLAKRAAAALPPTPSHGVRLFSARNELPDAWYEFLHEPTYNGNNGIHKLVIPLAADQFPMRATIGQALRILRVRMLLQVRTGVAYAGGADTKFQVKRPQQSASTAAPLNPWPGELADAVLVGDYQVPANPTAGAGDWEFTVLIGAPSDGITHTVDGKKVLDSAKLVDLVVLLQY